MGRVMGGGLCPYNAIEKVGNYAYCLSIDREDIRARGPWFVKLTQGRKDCVHYYNPPADKEDNVSRSEPGFDRRYLAVYPQHMTDPELLVRYTCKVESAIARCLAYSSWT